MSCTPFVGLHTSPSPWVGFWAIDRRFGSYRWEMFQTSAVPISPHQVFMLQQRSACSPLLGDNEKSKGSSLEQQTSRGRKHCHIRDALSCVSYGLGRLVVSQKEPVHPFLLTCHQCTLTQSPAAPTFAHLACSLDAALHPVGYAGEKKSLRLSVNRTCCLLF